MLADLTDENRGAYREAGYAEGSGKPVIYICKREKFRKAKTHFDTNHCTTITWSADDAEGSRTNWSRHSGARSMSENPPRSGCAR